MHEWGCRVTSKFLFRFFEERQIFFEDAMRIFQQSRGRIARRSRREKNRLAALECDIETVDDKREESSSG
jgi:hypothetical protein